MDQLLEPDGGEQLLSAFCDRFRPNPAMWRKDAGFFCVCRVSVESQLISISLPEPCAVASAVVSRYTPAKSSILLEGEFCELVQTLQRQGQGEYFQMFLDVGQFRISIRMTQDTGSHPSSISHWVIQQAVAVSHKLASS